MIRKHTISIKNALHGAFWALRTQPNYRIHVFLSLLAIFSGLVLKISYNEFVTIILLVTLGLSIETINTAIEETTDAIDTKWREDIKIAKDVAAGAMLIFAFGSFFIACMIFIPRFILLLKY